MRHPLAFVIALAAFCSCGELPVYNLENEVYKTYLDETVYLEEDHTSSTVENYMDRPADYKKDRPAPVILRWKNSSLATVTVSEKRNLKEPFCSLALEEPADSAVVWNLIPGRKYYYSVTNNGETLAKGAFMTSGRRRMLYFDDYVRNVRDLGGLPTNDGRHIRYGLIFRGSQMDGREGRQISEEGRTYMRETLGVKADLDLRNIYDLNLADDDPANDINSSPLGQDIDYVNVSIYGIDQITKETHLGEAYKTVLGFLREGKPVYYHCAGGADRTGILSMMIELSVGVRSEDVLKDYETTSFSKFGIRARNNDCCQAKKGFVKFYSLEGETMEEIAVNFLLGQGVTREEMDEMASLILE